MTNLISIKKLNKSFNNQKVLHNIDIDIKLGEVIAIIGPSGSGKSTLLRSINLLETPDSGELIYKSKTYFKNKKKIISAADLSSIRSKVTMVFQSFNLFNNMSVIENLNLAQTEVLKLSSQQASANSLKLLARVGLSDKKNEPVNKLSGGQKQRIAIARALALQPEVILFDEPTSALDIEMVKEVLNVIKDLVHEEKMTIMIVTHELSFAKKIANRIVFMNEGRIEEIGSPNQILKKPKSVRLKKFLEAIL
jgi:polar amino acid transport system ATP-binding protein